MNEDTLCKPKHLHGIRAITAEPKKSTTISPETKKDEKNPAYLLTSQDHPGTCITQVKLLGDNYEEWAHAIRVSLRAK